MTTMLQNTPNPALAADIELTPERCEYIGVDKIRVSLKPTTGEIASYTLSSAALVQSVNMSVALINTNVVQALRGIKVF
jgi:hypothetical protein